MIKSIKIIPQKFKSLKYYMDRPRKEFYNPILGYFSSQEKLDRAIKESGIIQKNHNFWAIPLIEFTHKETERGLWKRGEIGLGVDPQFENYKNNKKNKIEIKSKQMHL